MCRPTSSVTDHIEHHPERIAEYLDLGAVEISTPCRCRRQVEGAELELLDVDDHERPARQGPTRSSSRMPGSCGWYARRAPSFHSQSAARPVRAPLADGLVDVNDEDEQQANLDRHDERIRHQLVRILVEDVAAEENQGVPGYDAAPCRPREGAPVKPMSSLVPTVEEKTRKRFGDMRIYREFYREDSR